MMRYSWLVFLAACHASPRPGGGERCLAYVVEARTDDAVDVGVRERHGGECGGDPAVEPIVARFRIHRSGAVERYEIVTDSWTPKR